MTRIIGKAIILDANEREDLSAALENHREQIESLRDQLANENSSIDGETDSEEPFTLKEIDFTAPTPKP